MMTLREVHAQLGLMIETMRESVDPDAELLVSYEDDARLPIRGIHVRQGIPLVDANEGPADLLTSPIGTLRGDKPEESED